MEKINIANLLKDCPTGYPLDCTMYEDVYFDFVDELNIIHCYIQREILKTSITFNQYGTPNSDIKSKCVIYPKDETTWEGFVPPRQFKDGDILATDLGSVFYLNTRLNTDEYYGCYVGIGCDGSFYICEPFAYKECCGFATEEEKQRLFKAIKDNGYKWNAETKTLEKLVEPKFKVGDKVRHKNNHGVVFTITNIEEDSYVCGAKAAFWFDDQDDYEVIHEPKFKVGDRVRKKGDETATFTISDIGDLYYYCGEYIICNISYQDNYELVPNKFDISTLKPFDKVLVRNTNNGHWRGQFYMSYDKNEEYPFECVYNCWKQCIPYEENKHLLGKTDNCTDFYKNWE